MILTILDLYNKGVSMDFVLLNGDCLEELKNLPSNSMDSLVTDPPAGISFMGKAWDKDKGGRKQWVAWMTEVMQECMRVLKPGAHGLVWAIPRTSHWTATALEDAGFEIRDVVTHIFGSGFPKSMDISKAITSNEAKQWEGWGTALKPASEHWILVRKPCSEKTVAANVLEHGTGGINIDVSRISTNETLSIGSGKMGHQGTKDPKCRQEQHVQGRFPANLVLSHNFDCNEVCTEGCAVAMLDEQSGTSTSKAGNPDKTYVRPQVNTYGKQYADNKYKNSQHNDSGGASRFFYCAKASKKDKGSDNTHPTVKSSQLMTYLIKLITPPTGIVLDPFMGSGSTGVAAIKAGFAFIGIEKDLEYYAISENRIKALDLTENT